MIPKIFKMCNKKEYKDRTNFRTFNKGKIQDLTLNRDQLYLQKRSLKKFLKIYQNLQVKDQLNSISFFNWRIQHQKEKIVLTLEAKIPPLLTNTYRNCREESWKIRKKIDKFWFIIIWEMRIISYNLHEDNF
jgi:hypothetical protein